MIVIGYTGIGKTSWGGVEFIVDLDIDCFKENITLAKDSLIHYCKTAESISKQGFIVFVAAEDFVVSWLKANTKELLFVVYPSPSLKIDWCIKLQHRYDKTRLPQDYTDWVNVKASYDTDIQKLSDSGIPSYVIQDVEKYTISSIMDALYHDS